MAKDPAVLLYVQDFLVGTSLLTPLQKGHYITLLCYQQQSETGSLPELKIKQVMGKDYLKHWTVIKSKFVEDENGFYNARMRQEVTRRAKYSESRRNNRGGRPDSTDGDTNRPDPGPGSRPLTKIYLIRDDVSGLTKIGASVNPERRLEELKTTERTPLQIERDLKLLGYSDWVKQEREYEVQKVFKHVEHRGEWYRLTIKDYHMIADMLPHMSLHMETEIETERKGGAGEKWNTRPGPDQMDLKLPDIKAGAVVEFFGIAKKTSISHGQVSRLWTVFKQQHFNGEKYYGSENEAFSHFINWSQTKKIEDAKPGPPMEQQTAYKVKF